MKKFAYLALVLALTTACGGNKMQMPEAGNDFAVETLKTTTADLKTSYPAAIKGVQDIEIRAKVSGHITAVLVDEGAMVSAGQPLFRIDATQYSAQVKSARAAVNVVRTNIATQELTLSNKKLLREKGIISQYDLDVAQNQLETLNAQLAQAQAALANAEDNLRFCTITAPSTGVVGSIPYRVGSLVGATSPQALTTVSNLSQMYAYFSLTEKQLLELTRQNGGSIKAVEAMPAVELQLTDGTIYSETGHVTSLGGLIDAQTGAVQARATFANPAHILRSGGTGNILVPIHNDHAILIPQGATYDIQNKKFAYVVNSDNTVEPREIDVMVQNDGKNYVVTAGLKAGDRIVIEGVNQLKRGMKINPITREQLEKNKAAERKALKDGKMPGEK